MFIVTVLDAGVRTPRGILTGNTQDLGNYYQCLGIKQEIPNSVVEGKYCMINVPLEQIITESPDLPDSSDLHWQDLLIRKLQHNSRRLDPNDKVVKSLNKYNDLKTSVDVVYGGLEAKRLSRYSYKHKFIDFQFKDMA